MPEPIDAPLLRPMSPEAEAVVKTMKPGLRYTAFEIADALRLDLHTTRMRLARMVARGHLVQMGERGFHRYRLPTDEDLETLAQRRREECIGRNLPANWRP